MPLTYAYLRIVLGQVFLIGIALVYTRARLIRHDWENAVQLKLWSLLAAAFAASWALAQPAYASSDSACYPEWSLINAHQACANTAVIAPGNDSRVNLFLLASDQGHVPDRTSQPDNGWDNQFGEVYFNWRILTTLWAGVKDANNVPEFYGTRCGSYAQGTQDFEAALKRAGGISSKDRITLIEARFSLYAICALQTGSKRYNETADSDEQPQAFAAIDANVARGQAREFLIYLGGAAAFYNEDFDRAENVFNSLADAKNDWVKEASRYMQGRVAINQSQAVASDAWGYFDVSKADASLARNAEKALKAYVADYPGGLYTASATGLMRRAYWLAGDQGSMAEAYGQMVNRVSSLDELGLAIQEADNSLLVRSFAYALDPKPIPSGGPPMLRAVRNLLTIRQHIDLENSTLGRAFFTQQKADFAGQNSLYSFILANYDFYIARDYRSVLKMIPDAARQSDFSYLQFSRQALRGQALAMLEDKNEGGFWREMLAGSKARYQRAAVELGLASFYERSGELDKVFADGSPITKPLIRRTLITAVADADNLRAIADNSARPQIERDTALLTLLYKQLSRGYYSSFARDVTRVDKDANSDIGLWNIRYQEAVPVGLFTTGKSSENLDCPAPRAIAQTLAANENNYKARLCLGDFWRVNGFDYFDLGTRGGWQWLDRGENAAPVLGNTEELFPGKQLPRLKIYQDIIADKAAPAQWRSYALYRAVRCYAPSGSNSCGGKDVAQKQRQSWFRELKRRYPSSPWARQLEYYW